MAQVRKMAGYTPGSIRKVDYIYAVEVAGQPASTPREKAMKAKAKQDVKYLEAKFPSLVNNSKSFSDRMRVPGFQGVPDKPMPKATPRTTSVKKKPNVNI